MCDAYLYAKHTCYGSISSEKGDSYVRMRGSNLSFWIKRAPAKTKKTVNHNYYKR